jgi:tight adherence protein B
MRSIRRTRTAALALATALLLGLAAPAAAQSDERLEVRNVDAGSFPLVRAVVAGPPITGDPTAAFTVSEDGQERNANVVRLRTDSLNVVVAMDVSGSMRGEPIEQAKVAMGELLDTLPETVPVSVVSFANTAVIQSPFTTDRDATRSVVNGLIAGGGTALNDAVRVSLAHLAAQGGAGSLIVLADGDDSDSSASTADAIAALEETDSSVAFVGLRGPEFDPANLEGLAAAAGGQLVSVDEANQLGVTLQNVAAMLSRSYEVRWNSSSQGDSGEVTIALAERPDVSATATFEHDAVRQFVPDIAADVRVVPEAGLISGAWVPIAAALGVSLGLYLLLSAFRSSAGAVERREQRKQAKETSEGVRQRKISGVQERLQGISGQVLAKNNRGRSLDDTLDRAGLAMRSNEFVVTCAAVGVAAMFVGILLFGVPYFLLMAIPLGLGIPGFLKFKTARRRKAFVNQLGDTLQLMAGSLTAGYGLGQTLDSVARETDSPTSEEFQRVVMETRLGRTLEDALDAMSHRIGAKDFDWVVDAIKIQSSVGGNLSEIIDQVGETIRARTRIKRQVDALTAEGKISALVLFVLPFGLFGFIFSSNPDYIKPMFSSGMGQVMLGAAMLMLTCGGLWLKKLVNPEF